MGLNRDLGNIPEIVTVFNGNFGIGTNSAISTLQSAGTITVGPFNNASTVGNMQLITGGVSPTSNRITYGTDGTGWRFAIGKNQGGTITDQLVLNTNGNVLIGSTTDNGAMLQINGRLNTSSYYGSTRKVTITALNTDFVLFPGPYSGIITIRDNTNGGSAVWLVDPNNGAIQIANNMPGTWSIAYSFGSGTTNIRKTSGSVSVLISFGLYGNNE